jgi:hypothetical protein
MYSGVGKPMKDIGDIKIRVSFSRHVGPRFFVGDLTLGFRGSQSYSFSSEAVWPTTDQYEDAIQDEVNHEFVRRLGHLPSISVTLLEVGWDPVESCAAGFRRAAAAAVVAALATCAPEDSKVIRGS